MRRDQQLAASGSELGVDEASELGQSHPDTVGRRASSSTCGTSLGQVETSVDSPVLAVVMIVLLLGALVLAVHRYRNSGK